jgi:hypothetical protein
MSRDDESYLSIFTVDGFLATGAPGRKPPPYIPQGPRSLSAAAVEPVVPSIYVIAKSRDSKLTEATLKFHHLGGTRANALADALEKAAKELRAYKSDSFDLKDPGVDLDVTAVLVRRG